MPTPSLILVPARFKTGKLYTPVATTSGGLVLGASGDFNVTRATTATRFNSAGLIESVASGIPRLDYYTSGGTAGCPALLVEPSGSNGILNSQNTATSWTLGVNLTSGYTDVIGVSGNNLTVAVSGSGIGFALGRLGRAGLNVALASGSTYTISFLMKQTGAHTIGGYYAAITGGAAGDLGAGFNVSGSFSSGSVFNSAGTTSRIRRVERFGTDVFRCSETFTMSASGTLTNFFVAPLVSVTLQDNPAVGTTMSFAAPQIELGAIPTSFIPTTTAAVTRNADVISVTGAVSGCIGQTEGTIYAEVVLSSINANQLISLGTLNDRIMINFDSSGSVLALIRVGGVNANYTATIPAIPATGGVYKIALGYKANDYCFAVNGVAYASIASRGVPANMSALYLGASVFSTAQLNDRIRAAALYTTRLTNSELAALTTL
jgi:hypothetical protein